MPGCFCLKAVRFGLLIVWLQTDRTPSVSLTSNESLFPKAFRALQQVKDIFLFPGENLAQVLW